MSASDYLKARKYLNPGSQRHRYFSDTGKRVLRVACSQADLEAGVLPYVIVQAYAPIGFREIDWEAFKIGTPPVCPAPDTDTPSGDVSLTSHLELVRPTLGYNQDEFNWAAAGRYLYLQGTRRSAGDDFETGNLPFALPKVQAAATALYGASFLDSNDVDLSETPPGDVNFQDPNYVWPSTTYAGSQFFDAGLLA